jgi:hypothetical protein
MEPDYAKATAELLERLRKRKGPAADMQVPQASQVYINAPRDCVIVISPSPKPPLPESGTNT